MQSILLEIPPPSPATSWTAIGIGVATIVYVAFIRPLGKKKKEDPLSRPPGLARQRSVERDMSNLLVELSEMARQMTGQLDTRAARLEALLGIGVDMRGAGTPAAVPQPGSRRNRKHAVLSVRT